MSQYHSLFAQVKHSINYTTDQGLPSNQVYSVYQDKNGLMWFATDRGVASYNGSYFKKYDLLDGLPDDVVFGFYPQKDGYVYCSTQSNQVFYFHPDTLVMKSFRHNKLLQTIPPGQMRDIKLGDFGFRCRFLTILGYVEISKDGILKNRTQPKKEHHYYLAEKDNYHYVSNQKKDKIFPHKFTLDSRLVFAIKDNVACGSGGGGIALCTTDSTVKIIKLYKDSITQNSDVGVTKTGFWVATVEKGLRLYSKEGILTKTYIPDKTTTFYVSTKDGVWVTTLYDGVYFFPHRKIKTIEETINSMVYSLSGNGRKELLVGLYDRQLLHFDRSLRLKASNPTQHEGISEYGEYEQVLLHNGSSGNLYFALKFSDDVKRPLLLVTGHNIYNYKNQNLLSLYHDKLVYDVEFFEENIIYAGSGGIYIADSKGNLLHSKKIDVRILDLDVVGDKIYLATHGRGLIILDHQLKTLENITTVNGLLSNYLTEVLIDPDGSLWICGRNGVNVIKRKKGKRDLFKLTTNNGLLHPEVKDIIILNDTIFLGTRKGVNYFPLNQLNEIAGSNVHLKLSLLSVRVNEELGADLSSLKYNQNDLIIQYELAAFIPNGNLKFQYRLLGYDSSWIQTKDRSVRLNSLQPGNYTVEIQAVVDGEPQGEKIILHFTIYPAFYTTWWFRLSVLTFFVLVVWLFFKYRILNYNREIIREILRQLLKKLRRNKKSFVVRSNGKDIRINSSDILYIESNGNYINIYTLNDKVVVREKLSNFLELVPDPLEYMQLKRSLIVRIDCITAKSVDTVTVNRKEFRVGNTYLKELKKIQL